MYRVRIQHWVFHQKTRTLWRSGIALLTLSVLLLVLHILEVKQIQDIGLPLATVVPDLERRLQILEEQVELARVHAATNRGAPGEFVHVYVLPEDASLDRIVASFETLHDVLKKQGHLTSMTPIYVGEIQRDAQVNRWPISFTVRATEEGFRKILLFLHLAGFFTVADVLTPESVRQLMFYAESENPVGIVALEQFLSADLLSYTGEYQALTDMVRKSFVSPAFDRLFTGLQEESLLRDVRLLLGGALGEALRAHNAWPLRFMTVDTMTVTINGDGTIDAAFEVSAYSRK